MERDDAEYVILAVACATVVLGLFLVFEVDRDYWFDEAFSTVIVGMIEEPGVVWSQTDVHPPGMYVLQWAWMKVNPGVYVHMWMRLLSVMLGGLFVAVAGFFLLRVFEPEIAAGAAGFLGLSTTVLWYATEARMYILVLLLVALACWGIVAGKEIVSLVVLFTLPFVHYLAVVGGVWVVVLSVLLGKGKDRLASLLLFVSLCLGALLSAVLFAVPQRLRIDGLWIPEPSGLTSAVSGWFYAMHVVADKVGDVGSFVLMVVFILVVLLTVVKAYRGMKSREFDERQSLVLLAMLGAVCATLFGVLAAKVTGVYHHRFYLAATWLFAVGMYVVWIKYWKKTAIVAGSIVWIVALVLMVYGSMTVDQELKTMALQVPCGKGQVVVHDTSFTYFPFEVYGEERCGDAAWLNLLVTNLTERQGRSYGLDAVPRQRIYRLPMMPGQFSQFSYYYVDGGTGLLNVSRVVVWEGARGNLTLVHR